VHPWYLIGAGVAGLGALFMAKNNTNILFPVPAGTAGGSIVHPERAAGVDRRLLAFLNDWAALGTFPLLVVPDGGLRTDATQARIYARGRSTPGEPPYTATRPLGRTVSNAQTARETAHGHAGALDVAPYIGGAIPWGDLDKFRTLGAFGKARGLVWGGDWTSLVDMAHLEVPDWRGLGVA
jgi:hypothetical protein